MAWAALGIGAAILPKSKVAAGQHAAFPITGKSSHPVSLALEATWSRKGAQSAHLQDFANHLRKVVPAIVTGLRAGTNHR